MNSSRIAAVGAVGAVTSDPAPTDQGLSVAVNRKSSIGGPDVKTRGFFWSPCDAVYDHTRSVAAVAASASEFTCRNDQRFPHDSAILAPEIPWEAAVFR